MIRVTTTTTDGTVLDTFLVDTPSKNPDDQPFSELKLADRVRDVLEYNFEVKDE